MAKNIVLRSKLEGAGKTKRGLKGINSGLKNLAKSAMMAGAAYFTARGVISGFKAVIEAAGQQELAEKKLEAALGKTSKTLLNYASSLQKATAFGDEATIEAMSMMAAFTKDEEALKKLTAVTLDYAAATGTDLNAAAQLVGRTFGTSMNAMSRYGVAVEGAAGSTERLESLTSNLADMFGGQAKAQADTMVGAMEQMKNALGDVSEQIGFKLAPLVSGLAKTITALATSTSSETDEARILFNTLKDLNASEETRKTAIDEINIRYSQYLPNLLTESSSLEQIADAQDRISTAMLKRVAVSINEDKIRELMAKTLDLRNAEPGLIDNATEASRKYQDAVIKGARHADVLAQTQDQNFQNFTAQSVLSGLAELELQKNREQQIKVQQEINKLNEDAIALADSFNQTVIGRPEMPTIPMPTEEEAEILGDIIAIDAELAFQRQESSAAQLLIQNKINDLKKKQVLEELKQAALVQGSAVDAMKAVVRAETMEAVAGYIASVLKNVPFPLNLILAAGGGALVGGLVDSALSSFAQGGEFVTSGPQMIMVGDNPSGRERVQITPSEQSQSFNQGGITLNISAPLIDETVIDTIIPAIQRAQRLNLA